jgi:hypothetical protein
VQLRTSNEEGRTYKVPLSPVGKASITILSKKLAPIFSSYITLFEAPVMNNTETLDETSGTEVGSECSSIGGRMGIDRERIRHDPSIKKAVDRALSVSGTTFGFFFLLI